MDTITIDADKAIDLLREVVKGKEDFVYEKKDRPFSSNLPPCVYQDGGKPSCVVGQALFKAGLTIDELDYLDHAMSPVIDYVKMPERVTLTEQARNIFARAQQMQDGGQPWGKALADAEKAYNFYAGIA